MTTTITPAWGISAGNQQTNYGVVTNFEENAEAQSAYLQNEAGATILTKVYDIKKTVSITLLAKADTTTLPTVGNQLTIGTQKYTVLSVRTIENNQSFKKLALTLEAWTGAPTTPADS